MFISAGRDSRLLVWSRMHNLTRLIGIAELENKYSTACDISPDNNILAVGGLNNRCSLYFFSPSEPVMSKPVAEYTNAHHMLAGCKFISEREIVCAHGPNSYIHDIYDNSKVSTSTSKYSHQGQITGLDIIKGYSQNYITASTDKRVKMWDTRVKQPALDIKIGYELTAVKSCRLQPNFFATSYNNQVSIFDIRCTRSLFSFNSLLNYGEINSLEISCDGQYILAADDQGVIAFYDWLSPKDKMQSDQILNTPENMLCMQLSEDSQTLAIGSSSS